jgi:signal transduction histidine kinase/DNA-binding response OmpR family regulator
MSMDDKVNILVVDDLPEKVLVLRSVLEELGENIIPAYSGQEALRQALNHDFAVILLDVNMPDIDGLDTAALIRKRKRSAHTPIIFVTAFADELHLAQGYSLGAVDYILAPVMPDVLRTKVKVFVELFRLNRQIQQQAEERVTLAREQALRAAAEEATRRSSFLAEATQTLNKSLDFDETLRDMLRILVPRLGDLAAITVVADPARGWQSELAWVYPPSDERHTCRLSASEAPHDALRSAVDRVLASGKAERLDGLSVAYPPRNSTPNQPQPQLRSAVVLPLLARGRTIGALTLAMSCSGWRYSPGDLALAEDLAGRAAVALDNARLYHNIQEGDRRKNEFLAMLAHELRNPLAPIRNAVHVLRLIGTDEPILAQARDMIDRQVTHMARLIDDLLDMSRISRGKILLRKEPVDLAALVRGTVEDYRASLAQAGLTLETQLDDRELFLTGDPTRLAQVVGNVLHNAIKFTDPGGKIGVTLRAEPDGRAAVIAVRDTGIGIEPEMLGRVFDTFSQADRSLDRSRGGLGLGLSLVRGLVELHGGSVSAHSEGLGTGTEVRIRLLLQERAAPVSTAVEPSTGAETPLRIVVIEDNRDTAESLRILLELSGHQVETAGTGQEGVDLARAFRPTVVLCDIGVPGGMDGYGVAQALRQDAELSGTFLIAMTGYGQDEDRRRSQEAGFDVHLTKPVDPTDLQRLLVSLPARI